MMGYSQDEAEEVIGRVLSIIDSTEHFLSQTIAVLEEVGLKTGKFSKPFLNTCMCITCALIRILVELCQLFSKYMYICTNDFYIYMALYNI